MPESPAASGGLVLLVTDAGVELPRDGLPPGTVRASLADIRVRRLYEAVPEEFFRQYGRGTVIESFHSSPGVADAAMDFLSRSPESLVTLSGHMSSSALAAAEAAASRLGVPLEWRRVPAPRAVRARFAEDGSTSPEGLADFTVSGSPAAALLRAGIPGEDRREPAIFWNEWFRRFLAAEIVPALRPRSESVLFSFLKVLAEESSRLLNWASIAGRCGISGPCARDWAAALEGLGLLDLVGALPAPPPRRAKARPKLYWKLPGLGAWLADAMTEMPAGQLERLTENAVYLALRDAFPRGSFRHFLDTNGVEAPLILELPGGARTAFWFPRKDADAAKAGRHLASLARAGLVSPGGIAVIPPETAFESMPGSLRAVPLAAVPR